MVLSYKNLSFDELVTVFRDLKYANSDLLYSFGNSITLKLSLTANVRHIRNQADVWTQGVNKYRSNLMLKKYIGAKPEEWSQMLHEAYVYDRLRCLFYGLNFNSIGKLPVNISSFPGNVLLMHSIARSVFKFEQKDSQPFTMSIILDCQSDFNTLIQPVLDQYPNIKAGLTNSVNARTFYHEIYETILTGLANDRAYLSSRRSRGNNNNTAQSSLSEGMFEITTLTDDRIPAFLNQESNPLANSFLNKDFNRFFFNSPYNLSGPEALRYNESIFISRAIGFTGSNLSYEGNKLYRSVPRKILNDYLTRDEVYAVTGIKTDAIPRAEDDLNLYLGIVDLTKRANVLSSEDDDEQTSP